MSAANDQKTQLKKIEQEKRRLANARAALINVQQWADVDEIIAAHEYVSQLDTESRLRGEEETRIPIPLWVIRHLLRSYHPTFSERR